MTSHPTGHIDGGMTGDAVSDAEVVAFVQDYALTNGFPPVPVGPGTRLADAGLDSLGTAELLLSARAQLVDQGRLDPEATLLDLPALQTVADLGDLLRSLSA